MLPPPIRTPFLQFCNGELAPPEFEAWICAAGEVEPLIGRTEYLDLISADYTGRDLAAKRDLCRRILEQHHPGAFDRYRVTRLLAAMLADDESLLDGLRELVRLRRQGCGFIPIEFVGMESETDAYPAPSSYHLWDPEALARKLTAGLPYRQEIRAAARELLAELRRDHPDDV